MFKYLLLLSMLSVVACRESYTPPSTSSNVSNLVVEGLINSSADSTIITLSRTVKLTDSTILKPELHAILSVESDGGSTFNLTELPKGRYYSVGHILPLTNKYRLRIKTADSKTYLSDYVEVKQSPAIDSLSWKAQPAALQVYASTHDPKNSTTYYRYDYVDTWQFQTAYQSLYKVVNGAIVLRDIVNDDVFTCWQSSVSSRVTLASSAKLKQDVIYEAPVITVPFDSEKLSLDYSILVKQYALTKEAFAFWTNMQKNTEQLGSIFDAQPTQLQGNIHNINDATEIVVGYLSVGTVTQQRIFIKKSQLPRSYLVKDLYSCHADTLLYNRSMVNEVERYILSGIELPLYPVNSGGAAIGFMGAPPDCADCTLRGVNKKPTFWQ
ncbi:DUF4249 domain-containing protein [Mucilaginibacter agri]|uniref:DUF4249 family protein n=1 Tax=Mucilaginibacter agri TaxID=2695265 RepID=A0A965ZH90_9SPHI|nr:DUF4249 domain-containing protein [Mucilaginibacter agri]NCD70047.1 DUF4249 family protein [Mucilaginibacter agri]